MANNVKTDELGQFHECGIYTPARLIDLSGEVDEDTAVEFIKNIRILDHVGDKDIKVLINTPGGSVQQGLAIFDAIRECDSKVITHAVGPCWSMGACILQAGDERIISQNATIMIHKGTIGMEEDHINNTDRWYKEYKRIGAIYDRILLKRIREKKPRFKEEKLDDIMTFDTIYKAEDAIDMGLVDKIAGHKEF